MNNEKLFTEFSNYITNPLNWKPTNIFIQMKKESWRGKILWLLYPKDTYGQHEKRYNNLPCIKKLKKQIEKERGK